MRVKELIILLLLLICNQLDAKNYSPFLKHYNMGNGLIDNNITNIQQDKEGYIWIGTRSGISRFDGYTFKNYKYTQNSTFDSNTKMVVDKRGDIYVINAERIYLYNKIKDDFLEVHALEGLDNTNRIIQFQFDNSNKLWTLDANGKICSYNSDFEIIRCFTTDNPLGFTDFCFDINGNAWASDYFGNIHKLVFSEGKMSYNLFSKGESEISSKLYITKSSAVTNKIYVAYEKDDIKIFDIDTQTYRDLNLQKHYQSSLLIRTIEEIDKNIIWIGTNRGIIIYDTNKDEYSEIVYNALSEYSLQSQNIWTIFKDREGSIWMGSRQNGISYYSPKLFDVYLPINIQSGFLGADVRVIRADSQGLLWLVFDDSGLMCYNTVSGDFIPFPQITHTDPRSIEILDEKLWVFYYIHGAEICDLKGRRLKSYDFNIQPDFNNHILTSKVLSDGSLLVATDNGLFRYNRGLDRFVQIFDNPAIPTNNYAIIEDSIQDVLRYAGYTCKLTDYQTENYSFQEDLLLQNVGNEDNAIIDMTYDSKGTIWYLLNNSRVLKVEKGKQGFTLLSNLNGNTVNNMLRIIADDKDKVWISSIAGLYSININDGTISYYNEAQGLLTQQFNSFAGYKDPKGNLFIGTTKGLVKVTPQNFEKRVEDESIIVTSIVYYDRDADEKIPIQLDSIWNNKLNLRYSQNTFDIFLSTLEYQNLGSMRFEYQIGNNGWVSVSSNQISFINLPPNDYTLKIQVVDSNNNILVKTPFIIGIKVFPPWWKSPIAYLSYSLFLIGFIVFTIMKLLRKQKRKMQYQVEAYEREKEKELYQTKINFFYNIAHEIRTPVTLIKTPLDRLLKYAKICDTGYKSLQKMSKSTDRLLELINQLLNFRNIENEEGNQLMFFNEEIVSIINDIIEEFDDSITRKGLVLNKIIDVDKFYADIDLEAFKKIIYNLISNAVKYSKSYISIKLLIDKESDSFIIDFENDGNSIPIKDLNKVFEPFYRGENSVRIQGTGLGLSITKYLVTLHNGDIRALQSDNKMTIFRLSLPIKQEKVILIDENVEAMDQELLDNEPKSQYTVLVVEDDKTMSDYINSLLAPIYHVFLADNGKVALKILEEQRIHIIISDILMPIMDGYELMKVIKSDSEKSHIPIILLTGRATIQDKLKGMEMGADAYIEKPFSADILLVQISNLLCGRENLREFYVSSPLASLNSTSFSKADEEFLNKLNDIINKHLDDVNLNVNILADLMNMSRPTLYRKLNTISKTSPNDLIKIARLKKAAELLVKENMKIYEVSEAVGFRSQSYFWTSFIKHFGVSPSKYVKSVKGVNNKEREK